MKKGFTLIELLAVIVILAIIALIATPIVLSIINDSKESATLRSAEFYMDGVSNAIMQKKLKDPMFKLPDGEYTVMKDGNVCIGTYEDNICTDDVLEIEVNRDKPTSGTITIKDGEIVDYLVKFGEMIVKGDGTISTFSLSHFGTIPDAVTSIGYSAFSSNKLTSVIIKGKSSMSDFSSYGSNLFGWASGYSDDDITWQP